MRPTRYAHRMRTCTLLLATLLTFVVSSYVVVLRYPTPIALSDRLRRN